MDFTQDDIRSVIGQFETEGDCDVVLGWLTLLDEVADLCSIDGWSELPAPLYYVDDAIAELAIALASRSSDSAKLAPMRRCRELNTESLISM